MTSNINEQVAWLIGHVGPYTIITLQKDIHTGYSTNGNNLIVENIMMNDGRNNTEYRCVIITLGTATILHKSDPAILYVAGEYQYRRYEAHVGIHMITFVKDQQIKHFQMWLVISIIFLESNYCKYVYFLSVECNELDRK